MSPLCAEGDSEGRAATGGVGQTPSSLAFLKSYVIITHELLEDVDVEAVTKMEKWAVLKALLLAIAL